MKPEELAAAESAVNELQIKNADLRRQISDGITTSRQVMNKVRAQQTELNAGEIKQNQLQQAIKEHLNAEAKRKHEEEQKRRAEEEAAKKKAEEEEQKRVASEAAKKESENNPTE